MGYEPLTLDPSPFPHSAPIGQYHLGGIHDVLLFPDLDRFRVDRHSLHVSGSSPSAQPRCKRHLLHLGASPGSAVYAVSHLVRYIQGRKEGLASGGDLFLTVVPLLFTVASLIWPQTLLAFLPLVLGALLLVDALGKVPLTIGAIELDSPAMIPLAMSCFFPALLGILLMVNPFSAVHIVIRLFGIVLMITGVIELITAVVSHRTAEAISSETNHL